MEKLDEKEMKRIEELYCNMQTPTNHIGSAELVDELENLIGLDLTIQFLNQRYQYECDKKGN